MDFILWVFAISMFIYLLSLFLYWLGLFRNKLTISKSKSFASVVIAAKNEQENILSLLENLCKQDYPQDMYEIIIVDNESTDNTLKIINEKVGQIPNLRTFSTVGTKSQYKYKKAALNIGIKEARGEIILTSDADSLIKPGWISGVMECFAEKVGMVVGFTEIQQNNIILSKLQSLDYLMLMTAARGAINLGLYWGCAASNIAFRKDAFEQVDGYSKIKSLPGGDDSIFMQILKKNSRFPKIVFNPNKNCWAKTKPLDSWKALLQQRARWAGDANYMYKFNLIFYIVILATFFTNLAPIFYFVLLLFGQSVLLTFSTIIGLKFLGEYLFMKKATKLWDKKLLSKIFPGWFILQIPYVVLMGLWSFKANALNWNQDFFRK